MIICSEQKGEAPMLVIANAMIVSGFFNEEGAMLERVKTGNDWLGVMLGVSKKSGDPNLIIVYRVQKIFFDKDRAADRKVSAVWSVEGKYGDYTQTAAGVFYRKYASSFQGTLLKLRDKGGGTYMIHSGPSLF